jgi:hypothetical protein
MKNALNLAILLPLAAAACGGDAPPAEGGMPGAESAMTSNAMVTIVEPTDGAMTMGSSVVVRLEVSGVEIVPAGEMAGGTGHHHLYLDADLTPPDEPVPTVPGSIIHMGDASAEYTFEGVAPGEHRLIAVVADGAHFPLQPWVVDTVTFMVH